MRREEKKCGLLLWPVDGGRRWVEEVEIYDLEARPQKKAAVGTGIALLLPLVVDEGDGPVDQVKKQDEQGHHGSRQVRRQL